MGTPYKRVASGEVGGIKCENLNKSMYCLISDEKDGTSKFLLVGRLLILRLRVRVLKQDFSQHEVFNT